VVSRSRTLIALLVLASLAVLAVLAGCAAAPGQPLALTPKQVQAPTASHVAVIVMENKEAPDVLGARDSYLGRLARRYALATRSYAITHPSLPNYLALTSGSTQGVTTDCTSCQVNAPNLVDQLQAAHVSWKAYLEDMPSRCFTGAGHAGYAKRHNPFAYYRDVADSPQRCRRLVPFSQLAADLRHGALPTFVWISPNLCDDTHDCPVDTGDGFLRRTVPLLLRALGPHGYVVVTWDEGSTRDGCCAGAAAGGRIATIVAGPDVRRGAQLRSPVDHYGTLRTIEDSLGLPRLGHAADAANGSLRGAFRHAPHIT
jgi:hypothetical protein